MLSAGTRLGPYEIIGALGAGGMGEVYRARDTRLGRDVAIKILPHTLTADADARQRFEREARAISSLNHPHVCTLHDVGHQDGTDFLVMELVEGETLARRLEKGPLPTAELLRIGIDIADALDKAHRHGILHRDLKPLNIMLTKSGAKLMDFGLAKSASTPPPATALSMPTRTTPLTAQGTIVGTFQYMSPEQLEGQEADIRSDLFSFGAVLYEMATGKRAFDGKTTASVIAAVLERDPPAISSLQPMSPPALERVVATCLAKDPDERVQSAHDVKLQLEWIRDGRPNGAFAVSPHRSTNRLVAWTAVAVLAVLMVIGGIWIQSLRRDIAHRSLPLRMSLLPDAGFGFEPIPHISLSPDGRRLAWIAVDAKGQRTLRVRDLGSLSERGFADTEGARYPFWSPDGRYIAFFDGAKLEKIDSFGGSPQIIADAPRARGGAWGADGLIVFAPDVAGSLYRISAAGGQVLEVAKRRPDPGNQAGGDFSFNSFRYPSFLPDGRHFLFLARGDPDMVRVGSVDGGEPKTLLQGSNAAYTNGYLLFMRGNTLMAVRFDAGSLQVSGEPMVLANGVISDVLNHYGVFTVAGDTLIYGSGSGNPFALQIFNRSGAELASFPPDSSEEVPLQVRFSPDGERIATTVYDSGKSTGDLWIYEPSRNLRTRFTFGGSKQTLAVWSPDGSRILFSSEQNRNQLEVKPANLGQPEQPLVPGNISGIPDDWSSDGRFVIYHQPGRPDLLALPLTADPKPYSFLAAANADPGLGKARFSPDGRWVAYQSGASGTMQVYITSFPDHRGVWQVSTDGSTNPVWGPGGKEVFFVNGDNVYAAEVAIHGDIPSPGPPKSLFSLPEPAFLSTSMFDVSRDGSKFLLIGHAASARAGALSVISNWTSNSSK